MRRCSAAFDVTRPTDLVWRGSGNQRLVTFTALGAERYAPYLEAATAAPAMQFVVDAGGSGPSASPGSATCPHWRRVCERKAWRWAASHGDHELAVPRCGRTSAARDVPPVQAAFRYPTRSRNRNRKPPPLRPRPKPGAGRTAGRRRDAGGAAGAAHALAAADQPAGRGRARAGPLPGSFMPIPTRSRRTRYLVGTPASTGTSRAIFTSRT